MRSALRARLSSLNDVSLRAGASPELLDSVERILEFGLPDDHRSFLRESNAAQVYAGYFTLFGIGASAPTDILQWNDQDWWKFAWNDRCEDFFCFAETAWGDQYAYRRSSSVKGDFSVYFLDCLAMQPKLRASSFGEFLEREFLRCASDPYDALLKEARTSFGELGTAEHLIYSISPLLGAPDTIQNVMKMSARVSMIINGDLAIQLDEAPEDAILERLTPYEDSEGRMRLALIWS